MKIQKQKAQIRGGRDLKTQQMAVGGGKPQQVIIVAIPVELEATRAVLQAEPWRHLFPFALESMSLIAGREDDDKRGLDMTARGNVGDLCVEVYDGELADAPAFEWTLCEAMGKPKLLIDEKGEGVISFKLRVPCTKAQRGELSGYLDAEVFLSMAPAQLSLEEHAKAKADAEAKAAADDKGGKAKGKREPGPHDSKEGHVQYVFSADATAFIKSAVAVHADVKEHEVVERVRKLARMSAGLQTRRVNVSLEQVQEVVQAIVGAPLAQKTTAAE